MGKPVQLSFGLIVIDPEAHRRQQKVKERRCLSCDTQFLSAGPHNRICLKCKDLDGWTSPATSCVVHAAF
jgi:hypothetical protein